MRLPCPIIIRCCCPRHLVRDLRVGLCLTALSFACNLHAKEATPIASTAPAVCLPSGDGYLRARISGGLDTELSWGNEGMECTGAVRPTDGGIRMRFSRIDPSDDSKLVLVFGIAKLREGRSARLLPVNVTVMREGRGEFYSTQGDDKCMFDEVQQQPLVGIPHRARSYRVVARGFCTEPARAVRGAGAVLLSRFDIAGRVDFASEDDPHDAALTATSTIVSPK